ncbi:Xaa-Pro dipeptidase [Halioxenophilus sp. WMMB6]|uniref:Xaa-Pro dipeptidase n=1 Tax=Halioxenophilus sp. WMMB6 TaxID=3073815 RepID=UPI00295F00E2|nr:Xaa-Pro dipeptidase [Halioxenophilus sp. WMMB6]
MIANEFRELYAIHLFHRLNQIHQALGEAVFEQLVIDGGGLKYRFLDDTSYPFRLNPYLARLAPLQQLPDSFIIIEEGSLKPRLLVYQPRDYWHAVAGIDDECLHGQFQIENYHDRDQLYAELPNHSLVAYLGERPELVDQATANPPALLNRLDFQQAVKTDYEIACIARANLIAARGHERVRVDCQRPTSELALHLAYLEAIAATEEELPYDNIIACNANASTLHYTQRERTLTNPQSLLIDAGATYAGYCADISRTYCAKGGLFQELINAMEALQLRLVAAVKPGINYVSLHEQAYREIGQLLVDFNFLRCSAEQAVAGRLVGIFFPHGVGHLLGVQVHDRGGWQHTPEGAIQPPPEEYPFLRLTRTLAVNQVFTIEPGLYFIPQLLQAASDSQRRCINQELVEAMLPYGGIRIEDNVCVSDDGADNLTRTAFATLAH